VQASCQLALGNKAINTFYLDIMADHLWRRPHCTATSAGVRAEVTPAYGVSDV